MTMRKILAGGILAATLLPAAPALAQSETQPAQSVTQGAQIEDAVARVTAELDRSPTGADASDGEGGLYILSPQSILFVSANAGIGYQGNPLRSAGNPGGSGTAGAQLSAGARTKLGGLIDVALVADVTGTKYFRKFGPDNTVASGSLSVGVPLGRTLYAGAVGYGGYNFDDFFGRGIAFYGGSGFVGATVPVGRLLIQPSISGGRQWTGIRENDNTSAAARLAIVTTRGRLAASLSGGASRVWFDNFYEDVTFVARRDWQYDVGLTATYRLHPNLLLSGGIRYLKRDSTFDLASYHGVEGVGSVALTWRF